MMLPLDQFFTSGGRAFATAYGPRHQFTADELSECDALLSLPDKARTIRFSEIADERRRGDRISNGKLRFYNAMKKRQRARKSAALICQKELACS